MSDSGKGIAPEFLPRVFDLFAQDDGPDSKIGLGIGLALACRLVEMHGGTITVHSDGPGKGSDFVICMPLSAAATPVPEPETAHAERVSCRVLVIDDNEDAANSLAMLVATLGGQGASVFDGESGIREALKFRPEVVLLDIGMPGIDGYETCRRIRGEFGDSATLVAITGFGRDHDKERARQAGFNAHLMRPADPAALQTLLLQCSDRAPTAGTKARNGQAVTITSRGRIRSDPLLGGQS